MSELARGAVMLEAIHFACRCHPPYVLMPLGPLSSLRPVVEVHTRLIPTTTLVSAIFVPAIRIVPGEEPPSWCQFSLGHP